jgi:hypothetical protein
MKPPTFADFSCVSSPGVRPNTMCATSPQFLIEPEDSCQVLVFGDIHRHLIKARFRVGCIQRSFSEKIKQSFAGPQLAVAYQFPWGKSRTTLQSSTATAAIAVPIYKRKQQRSFKMAESEPPTCVGDLQIHSEAVVLRMFLRQQLNVRPKSRSTQAGASR